MTVWSKLVGLVIWQIDRKKAGKQATKQHNQQAAINVNRLVS